MNKNINIDINNRVKDFRLSQNISQAKFAEKIGFSQSAIKDMELGKHNVSDRIILAMQQAYGINPDWLRTGEGEQYTSFSGNFIEELRTQYGIEKDDIDTIKAFIGMQKKHRDLIANFIYALNESPTR